MFLFFLLYSKNLFKISNAPRLTSVVSEKVANFKVRQFSGLFCYSPRNGLFPPVEAVTTATSVFTEYFFWESVDSAHNSQISSTFQKDERLLKLVKTNKQVVALTLLNRNLNPAAQLRRE